MKAELPIGELDVPEKVTLEDIQESLANIEMYTKRLRETVDALSDEELSKWESAFFFCLF